MIESEWVLCEYCHKHQAVDLHHIVPRSRTSGKHPAKWLNDPRNLIALCRDCHAQAQGREMRVKLVAEMRLRHPDWTYNVEPWLEYL